MKHITIFLLFGILTFGQASADKKTRQNIEGNFLVKGKITKASSVRIKEGQGNPVEEGTPDEYEIRFSDRKLKPIKAGCCEIILINEGDLNNNGTDEISVYQAPVNGCTYSLTTYSHIKGNWKKIFDTFLIPTGCEIISTGDLQKMITRENKNIYYLEKDMNDENGKLIKKKLK